MRNDFQMGIKTSRRAMSQQKGVRVRIPRSAFAGYWKAPKICTGYITGAARTGRFVARARFHNEDGETLLTSSSLMLASTRVKWRPVPATVHTRDVRLAGAAKHTNAVERARDMMATLVKSGVPLADKKIITLDGIGTNRVGFTRAMDEVGVHSRPEIITCEMDADVALVQTVALGVKSPQVLFTGGDPAIRGGKVTVENILTRPNALLSEEAKRKVVFLNLDYCGGPPNTRNVKACAAQMTRVLDHLPALHMVAYTMARRNHVDLDKRFDSYIPQPYGFELARTYTQNARVLCKLYIRTPRVVRTLRIPGAWWRNVDAEVRKCTYDGVVRRRSGHNTFTVYVPFDDAEYEMRADAVLAYKSTTPA